ncbi:Cof-type HAD-IIB family hydrolase [Metabacillus indicus]|uniref:Cof-type HAD-IIB family hydrolase n=1 Tax=Metabacillus indicus TaxID=246786 RepID=UPI003CF67705
MTYKIVFFDIDGTITHHENGTISEPTKAAVGMLLENGTAVVAATGRPLSMCGELMEMGIETFITANGGYVKHKDEVIHKVPLDKTIVKEVAEFAAKEKHALSFYTEDFRMNGIQNASILRSLKETLSLTEYPGVFPDPCLEEVFLLCLFAGETEADLYREAFPHLTFKRWHPYVLNVLDQDVSKSLAILKTLEYFGCEPADAAAFGDGDNDIDMIELAGLGIAMGNGSEGVKKAADFVTKRSGDDGVVFALKKFGII